MKKYAYIGALGFLAVITTEFGIIGILPQVAKYYHISIDKAGWLLGAFALVIALTGPFMTLLASGFDRKKVMLCSVLMFFITGAVSATAPPFYLLMLVRILPAFLQPVYIATALSVAVSKGNKENQNELMSIVFSGVALAMVTTVPFATYIASLLSWKYSFIVQAIISMVTLLVIYFSLPSIAVQQKQSYGSQLKILTKPVFVFSTLVNFFMIAAWFSTYGYFVDYLNKVKHLDDTVISYLLFVFGVVGLLANYVAGKMLNRNVSMTVAFFLSGTLVIPLLLYISSGNLIIVVIIVALWGFLYSPSFLNASTYMISSAPEAMAFANSLATSFGNLGVTLGITVGGWIIVNIGAEYAIWATLIFGLLAFLMMALRYLFENRRYHPKDT